MPQPHQRTGVPTQSSVVRPTDAMKSSGSTGSDNDAGPPVSSAPSSLTTIGNSPAPHSCTTVPVPNRPIDLSTHAVPMDGWPANGSSTDGVKMRARYVAAVEVGVSTNVVSDKLNSRAIDCICAPVRPSALRTTASGLPAYDRSVNTSTT